MVTVEWPLTCLTQTECRLAFQTTHTNVMFKTTVLSSHWDWSGLPCLVQLLTCLQVSECHDFWIILRWKTLNEYFSINNNFSYRNVFQNNVNSLSKMVIKTHFFLSKSSKLYVFRPYYFVQISLALWFKP